MPAIIREDQIPAVVKLLREYDQLDDSQVPADLDAEEVAMISKHRRDKLLRQLENVNIQIKPAVRDAVETRHD